MDRYFFISVLYFGTKEIKVLDTMDGSPSIKETLNFLHKSKF